MVNTEIESERERTTQDIMYREGKVKVFVDDPISLRIETSTVRTSKCECLCVCVCAEIFIENWIFLLENPSFTQN